jgi:hypothetical protein
MINYLLNVLDALESVGASVVLRLTGIEFRNEVYLLLFLIQYCVFDIPLSAKLQHILFVDDFILFTVLEKVYPDIKRW